MNQRDLIEGGFCRVCGRSALGHPSGACRTCRRGKPEHWVAKSPPPPKPRAALLTAAERELTRTWGWIERSRSSFKKRAD